MRIRQTRRRVLSTLALGLAAPLVHIPRSYADEQLETTSVRILEGGSICTSPTYVADDLLRAEGFTDIRHVFTLDWNSDFTKEADFAAAFASSLILQAAAGVPFRVLTGLHVGCVVLFANDNIRSIVDLKGKRVGVFARNDSPPYAFLSVMAAQVGLDPHKDIDWVVTPPQHSAEMLVAGKIDAMIGFPPQSQQWRDEKIGHVVVNSTVDRPWSDYFCCMLMGSDAYIRKHPVATKRVVRAILKTADLCTSEPTVIARRIVDGPYLARIGFDGGAKGYDYTLQAVQELPYDKWREYDPEDTVRFYALRLREAGLIKATPQQIIADHTDWRFLDQLKRELKA